MKDQSPGSLERSQVEQVFAEFLRSSEAGSAKDFDAFCRANPQLDEELRLLHGNWLKVAGVIEDLREEDKRRFRTGLYSTAASIGSGADSPSAVLRRLRERKQADSKFSERREINRGGMGTIFRVKDHDLRRSLAMKVARLGSASDELRNERVLSRFLEEAQITGQLDHPGVVPVHELGVNENGQPFFTMQLVRGTTLRTVFADTHSGRGEWTQTRALEVLLRVCDAMSYAHSKNVLHRDLKPSNVMVGRFGETYVMDWGLACVVGETDAKDIRLRDTENTALSDVLTERKALKQSDTDSPLLTMDGDVFGTPAYMSPEQAEGRVEEMGPESDVFSVGAMLYHLLSGQMPYVKDGQRASGAMVLRWVLDGPPKPVDQVQPSAPPELVAICEKAMARDPRDRYKNMRELSDELRAFLDGRVVRAYRTGAGVEFVKWVKRNRGIAALSVALLFVTVAAGGWSYALEARARRSAQLEAQALADAQGARDHLVFEALSSRASEMWPNTPDTHAETESWIDEAQQLVGKYGRDSRDVTPPNLREWAARFEGSTDAVGATTIGLIDVVQSRLESARKWTEASLESAPDKWTACQEQIAHSPIYGGLNLARQWGLAPLGPDPSSGLQEFAHLPSGEAPVRDANGELQFGPDSSIVLVLLPAGTAMLGTQRQDENLPFYDPNTQAIFEGPLALKLDAFFLSKYELTQEQWLRMNGSNPSFYRVNELAGDNLQLGCCHPVESVSWATANKTLEHFGLSLPTEGQWEYGARAGTEGMFGAGSDVDSLRGFANIADAAAQKLSDTWEFVSNFNDGYPLHAPVMEYRANPFGLHSVIGNVYEYCADAFSELDYPARPKDGLRSDPESTAGRSLRGGSFRRALPQSRIALRVAIPETATSTDVGIRPARAISDR